MRHPVRRACVFGATGGIGSALVRLLANDSRVEVVHAGSRKPVESGGKVRPFAFDLANEVTIREAAATIDGEGLDLVIVATGALHFPDREGPEKSYRVLDPARMASLLEVNAIGPAMIAKHFLPLLPREGRSVFAALSARVGSISDNGLGGWHSYRASKAALKMLMRNFAIEVGRSHRDAIIVSLHPGTVDTALSEPFQSGLPEGQLQVPDQAARHLLGVIDSLTVKDSGSFFAWDGDPIAY
ncbi:MAG: SDR family NAD(P)-dependent oxidoreductase [Novosphingobium sp.]|nr:SDR family NAD(P)-dependent oxidoreductase [Novosphingobium sp.]